MKSYKLLLLILLISLASNLLITSDQLIISNRLITSNLLITSNQLIISNQTKVVFEVEECGTNDSAGLDDVMLIGHESNLDLIGA